MPNSHPFFQQAGLKLYTLRAEEEINKFANKVTKCDLNVITDNVITIHEYLKELEKADTFAVLPEDLRNKYLELKKIYDTQKETLGRECICISKRELKVIKK